jgi:signal transduction histidine kinase/DNA-binding NarL/FixJ family response regulator
MSVRAKIAATIIAIGSLVVIVGIGGGLVFTNYALRRSIQADMDVVADTADRLITSEINLLKAETSVVAWHLQRTINNFHQELKDHVSSYENFLALTVVDRTGIVDSAGSPALPVGMLDSEYIQRALAGESLISSSYRYPGTPAGRGVPARKLVFFVCVPMEGRAENRILVATIDGMFFSEVLKNLNIWKTGHIFIDDEEGYVLANPRENWVRDRWNFIEKAKTDPQFEGIASVISEMIQGNSGMGIFALNGQDRFCTYRPITGSRAGWSLGVVAPTNESPLTSARDGLLLVGFISIMLCIIAAVFASSVLEKPYNDAKLMMAEMKVQDEQLIQANNEALMSSEAKSAFLANMSHEMRTPLNAIVGLSELTLSSGELEEGPAENVEKVYGAGMTLLGIVNDILDLSKIESGKFELIPVEYDISSLINDTIVLNTMRIGDKPIQFHLHIDGTLPSHLFGDELRIKQIFNNLLSNAFKYTRQGNVDWTISFEPPLGELRPGDGLWLTSTVQDSGIGIRQKDIEKLFSQYNQADAKTNREIEGTGLGLSITKRMVEMMDGSITVESEYGTGSTFTVRLRQQFVSAVSIGDDVARNLMTFRYTDSKRDVNKKLIRVQLPYAKVLVVDDVATNLDVAKGLMKPYGMQVDCASGGSQAIELIRSGKTRYTAIFMDHMMPGMDGIEATRIIREEIGTEYARNIPIIALTANAIVGNEEMFLANGFQAFLSKPIDIMAMDAVIRQWVRNKELEPKSNIRISAIDPSQAKPWMIFGLEVTGIDTKKGTEHFGGDQGIYWDVVKSFAENTPPLLEKIRVYSTVDLTEYGIIVHGIKSSSRSIGAEVLGEKAEALEYAAKAGDVDFVRENHGSFIQVSAKLIKELKALISRAATGNPKQRKAEPAEETLEDLAQAARAFDIDGVDRALEELESFDYETGADLVVWLREKADLMGFKEIAGRLSKSQIA